MIRILTLPPPEPLYASISYTHVVVANSSAIFVWHYRTPSRLGAPEFTAIVSQTLEGQDRCVYMCYNVCVCVCACVESEDADGSSFPCFQDWFMLMISLLGSGSRQLTLHLLQRLFLTLFPCFIHSLSLFSLLHTLHRTVICFFSAEIFSSDAKMKKIFAEIFS